MNDRLNWWSNSDDVYKKGMSNTAYFLWKLRSFSVCRKMLEIFYLTVEAILLSSAGGQHQWERAVQDQQTNSQGRSHHILEVFE